MQKKHKDKRPLSQLNESVNDFVIGSNTNGEVTEDETVWPQINCFVNNIRSATLDEKNVR